MAKRSKIFLLSVFLACAGGFLLRAVDQPAPVYSADDFSRLVKQNPLVVAGRIRAPDATQVDIGGIIKVQSILKNDFKTSNLKAGDDLVLKLTSGNLFWSKTLLEYQKGQTGVWIINATAPEGKLQPGDVIAHFVTDESTLAKPPPGKRAAPLEQWGATNQVSQWAAVKVPMAATYDKKGKRQGTLRAGTCLDVINTTSSSVGEVVVCRLVENDGDVVELVIQTKDLNFHPGSLARVDENRKALCIRQAELQARITDLTEDLIESGTAGNPYTREYRSIKAAYDAYWAKAKGLQTRRDGATGASRMGYLDQLRMMKGEDVRLGTALEAVKKKYDAWQQKNANQKVTSPEIQAVEKELADVRQQIRQLP